MRFASSILLTTMLVTPTLAVAQDSTNIPSTTPNTNCTVSGGCSSTGTGSQPNTTPDSTLEGGTSGSTGGGGTLDNTGSGSTVDPGDSSGGGSSGGGNGAAGPLGNSSPD